MYEFFFGLREPAFSLTPDPRFLWLSETHEEGLAALQYGITSRKGFLLLTGEVGAGKTTLLRAVLQRLPEGTDVAMILNTAGLTRMDLLRLIAAEIRLPASPENKGDFILALNSLLLERLRTGQNTVLIVDEAQNLSIEALEEIRLLSNMETESDKLIQIVLTGQPELRQKLAAPSLRAIRQRIAIQHHVEPLLPEEIRPYLAHRIQVAGGEYESVFDPGTEELFYDCSRGSPRVINLLADRALLGAYAKQVRPVPRALVERKAKQLEGLLDSYSPGPEDL
jgi:general secretion pathway protein A